MKKELKDYLHLYLGCECILDDHNTGILIGFDSQLHNKEVEMVCYTIWDKKDDDWMVYNDDSSFERIKPILRPLSDMTEDEFYEFKSFADNDCSKMIHIKNVKDITTNLFHEFEASRFLLSKHFDLFGLIDSGLAVNAAEIKSVSSR